MPIFKLALWWDADWRSFMRKDRRKLRYWLRREITWNTGRYTLGPLRLEVNLPAVKAKVKPSSSGKG